MKKIKFGYLALLIMPFALFIITCGGGSSGSSSSGATVDPATPGYNELGCGTDVFEEYATENNVKGRVLVIDALNNDGLLVLNTSVQEAKIARVSGTSVSEYASELGVTVGLSGSYKWFSASIKSAFTDDTYKKSQYSYVTLMERHYKNSLKIMNAQWDAVYLVDYLTDEADMAINNTDPQKDWTPEQVISTFGTHVMVGIYTGARLDYNLSINITDSQHRTDLQLYAEMKANFKFASASFSSNLSQSTYNAMSTYEQRENIQAKGGNEQYARPGDDEDYNTWKDSIDSNPAFMGIIQDALVPIWTFADDPDREAAIENYYMDYALDKDTDFTPEHIHSAFEAFDDPEGWTAPNAGGFNWHLHVENPSPYYGHIEGIDGDFTPWSFLANSNYTGDMQGFYGGVLSYWFNWRAASVSECAFRFKNDYYYQDLWKPDVEIKGLNGTQIGYFFPDPGAPSPPGADGDPAYFGAPDYYNDGLLYYDVWRLYALPLTEYSGETGEYAYGWIKKTSTAPYDTPATEADILEVLENVDYVSIRGEYCFGSDDRGMVDEVWLKAPIP